MASLSCGFAMQPKTVYAGVLNKKGQVNKSWKKRWFVLYENRKLAYYASQNDVVNCKDPINSIDLSTINQVRIVNKPSYKKPKRRKTFSIASMSSKQHSISTLFTHLTAYTTNHKIKNAITSLNDCNYNTQFSFELVSPKRTYTLCCHHAASFNEWVDNLESAVFGQKLYKGWIRKQGEKRKTWKRRWFIIFNTNEMRYYLDDKLSKPKGSILLTDLLNMRLIDDGIKYSQPNILELQTAHRLWVLSADSKQNRLLWWQRISRLMNGINLAPIYEDHLFKYDLQAKCWIYKYFALDTKALLQFDKIEDCERYKNSTHFTLDLYRNHTAKYVQSTIALNKHPVIKRLHNQNMDDCDFKQFQKNNLFKIETNAGSYYFAADHAVQIERWFAAFKQLKKQRADTKKQQKFQLLRCQTYSFTHPLHRNNYNILTDHKDDNDIAPRLHYKSKTVGHFDDIQYQSFAAEITEIAAVAQHRNIRHRRYNSQSQTNKKLKQTQHQKRYSHNNIGLELDISQFTRNKFNHNGHYLSCDTKIRRRKTTLPRTQTRRTLLAKRPNMSIVSALMALGFLSENGCKRAALTVNNASAELAANWLFDNMENPAVHLPLIYSDSDDDIEYDNEYIFSDGEVATDQGMDRRLSGVDLKGIEDIPEFGLKADTYYKYSLWERAKINYTKAIKKALRHEDNLIYKECKDREHVDKIYKWYCYRSECCRHLKQYPQAVSDTNAWMERVLFNDDSFDFIEGCEIASGIWMDLRRFNASKVFIEKGLQIDGRNMLLQQRLQRVAGKIKQELAKLAVEIDMKQLELTVDIEEKCESGASDVEWEDIIGGWLELIGGKTAQQLFTQSADTDIVWAEKHDISMNECVQRLVFVMRVYGTWSTKVTQTDATEFMSMYDILSMLNEYSVPQLINDYLHVKEVYIDIAIDGEQHKQREIIWKYLQFKIGDCFDTKIAGLIKKRQFRDKSAVDCDEEMRAELYFGYAESSDIVTLQVLDTIYSFVFCSHEVVFNEDYNHTNELVAFIGNHQSSNEYDCDYEEVYSKYITNVSHNEFSEFNIGHNINNFIANKQYKTLKEELFNNKVYKISELEWSDVLFKGKLFAKTYKTMDINCCAADEGFLNEKYKIKANQPISLTHLIVLLLYTNNNKLRQTFLDENTSKEETANFRLILKECLIFYSKVTPLNTKFYHCISCDSSSPILFNEYAVNILSVTSLTKYCSVAMMNYNNMEANNNERYQHLVLELKQRDSSPLKQMDISFLSDAGFEGEYIVNKCSFSVCNMYHKYVSYEVYINSLLLFNKIINGQYLLHSDYHKQLLYQMQIVECMKGLMIGENNNKTPTYIQLLFNYLISKTSQLFLLKSQYENLSDGIWDNLIIIAENDDNNINKYEFGDFLSFWKAKNLKCAKFVNEYKWNENDLKQFYNLKKDEQLIGPELIYPLKKKRNKEQEDIIFVLLCKRLNSTKNKDLSELAIKCKRFPHQIKSIELRWNVLLYKAQFAICKNICLTKQNNYQCITFPSNLITQIDTFQFQIAIRVLSIK